MDLLKGEPGSSNETCVTSIDGNEAIGIEAERFSSVTEGEDREPMTVPLIKTEFIVSCVPVVCVMHISYSVYPELPAPIPMCPSETKISL
jgi:hypothetical protein